MLRVLSRLRVSGTRTAARAIPAISSHPLVRSIATKPLAQSVKNDAKKVVTASKAVLPVIKGLNAAVGGSSEEFGAFLSVLSRAAKASKSAADDNTDQKQQAPKKSDLAKKAGYAIGAALTAYNMFSDKDKQKSTMSDHVALIHARSEICTSELLRPAMQNILNRILDTEIRPAAMMIVVRDGVNTEFQLASIKEEWNKLLKLHNINLDIPVMICTQDRLYESNDKVRANKLATKFNSLSKAAILYCSSEAEAQHLGPIYTNAMKDTGAKFEVYDAWPKNILMRAFK